MILPAPIAPLMTAALVAPLPLILATFAILCRRFFLDEQSNADDPCQAQASRDRMERTSYRHAVLALWLSATMLVVALLPLLQSDAPVVGWEFGEWFAAGRLHVNLSVYYDLASLATAAVILGISGLALNFSSTYLHRDPGFHRAMAGLCLLPAGMLLLLLGGNAVLAFVGWELAGLASWLLIGYVRENRHANAAALLALVTNRVGDAGFLLAIGLCYLWFGQAEWAELLATPITESLKLRLLLFGFLVAALAKSAQWPFSFWLGRALEGPTPTSALFYAAVMVHAGVLLLLRLSPLLQQAPDIRALLVVFGGITVLHAGSTALTVSDVKSRIAHAGLAQIGLMLAVLGLGGEASAPALYLYLLAHMLWRGRQMLLAPSALVYRRTPPCATLSARRGLLTAVFERLPGKIQALLVTALLRRGWLEDLAQRLLVRPTMALARDAAYLDSQVIDRLLGVSRLQPGGPLKIAGHGLAGHLLMTLAGGLIWIEQHLVLQAGDGRINLLLRRLGAVLWQIEALLEQPRYLLLMIMATLVVII